MAHGRAIETVERSIDFMQKIAICTQIGRFRFPVQCSNRCRLIVEQAGLPFGKSSNQTGTPCLFVRCNPKRVRHERKVGARLLVFRDQTQQQALFERAREIEVTNLRIMLLAIAIDPPIALLQTVRIVRQIEMDQIEAALMQVQSLGQRVGADQNDAILLGTAFGGPRPLALAIMLH